MTVINDVAAFDVSLVICTYNRVAMIDALLQSIEREAARALRCRLQVVIVNNNSSDDTGVVCRAWAARQAFFAEVVDEPKPGLGAARNRGLAAVRGRIVAMTDDDCTLDEGFFDGVMKCHAEMNIPCIIGGRVELGDERDLPVTLVRMRERRELRRQFPAGFIIGANMTFSSDCMALVGPFDARLGAGAPLRSAEEADWLLIANQKKIPVIYDPRFSVFHFHGRRTSLAAQKLFADYYFGAGAMYAKHMFSEPRIWRWMAGSLRKALKDLIVIKPDPTLGVRRPYVFRLRHHTRGFLGYWRFAVLKR